MYEFFWPAVRSVRYFASQQEQQLPQKNYKNKITYLIDLALLLVVNLNDIIESKQRDIQIDRTKVDLLIGGD